MKDRVRIMLGSREIVKRYIGDRLVWESLKSVTIKNVYLSFYEDYSIWVSNRDIKTTLENKKITKVRIGTSEFPLITTKSPYISDSSYIFYLSSETIENFKRVGVTTRIISLDITFYYE